MGGALHCKKDYQGSLEFFEKARKVYFYLLGEDHYKTKNTLDWIEMVKSEMLS
jgi:hypothetical protein